MGRTFDSQSDKRGSSPLRGANKNMKKGKMSLTELKKIIGSRYQIVEYPIQHPRPTRYKENQYSARQLILTSLEDLYNYLDLKGHKQIAVYEFNTRDYKLWFESF